MFEEIKKICGYWNENGKYCNHSEKHQPFQGPGQLNTYECNEDCPFVKLFNKIIDTIKFTYESKKIGQALRKRSKSSMIINDVLKKMQLQKNE